MRQDFETGIAFGQALSDIRHLMHRDERHEARLDDHHTRISRLERRTPASRLGNLRDWYPAAIGVTALILAMAGRGDLAARLLGQ